MENGANKMTTEEAWKIIGYNSPRWAVRNMVKALKMCRWLNPPEEEQRLQAAQIVLRTRNPHYS